MKYCPYCGAEILSGAFSFCPSCGESLPVLAQPAAEKAPLPFEKFSILSPLPATIILPPE